MDDSPSQIVEKAAETATGVIHDAKGAAEVVLQTAAEVARALEASLNEHLRDEASYREEQLKDQIDYRARIEKSLASIHERISVLPRQEDILTKKDIADSLNSYFQSKGKMLFTLTVSAGILMGAITGIFVGLKSILAVFGFMLIHK